MKTPFLFAFALAAFAGSVPAIEWEDAGGVRIPIPPRERPRLYLRPEHAAQLSARLGDPALEPVAQRLRELAEASPKFRVEWEALNALATGDRARGRAAIEAVLPILQAFEPPDKQDACRDTGRMMVTGAIVYDWLHSLLTAGEKEAFIREQVRLAKTMECGYPPKRQGAVTGHASEAQIMRDMISAGIAIYDEFPEMYRLAAGRFFREYLPVRNWHYTGHAHHQGAAYGPYRFGWDTFPLFIFDRLGAGNVYNPDQRFVPYLWIYTTRPDGQRLRAGDVGLEGGVAGEPWSEGVGTLFTASYYGDGALLSQFLRQGRAREGDMLFEFLWRDTTLQPRPIEELPLTRFFGPPFGWMVARTGWGGDSVIAEMKINEFNFVNHQHLDAGAFQIYYKGPLAIDSGLYSGSSGKYGSPHCRNYFWRTIAHNSLLVHAPGESFGGDFGNDGGQRVPNRRKEAATLDVLLDPANGYRTGEVLGRGVGPDPNTPAYSLLQGDITAAYGDKVREVRRSFVFLNLGGGPVPGALIVFDRVVSADPAFRKIWLLHSMEEPRIDGASAVVDRSEAGGAARLTLDVLLPPAGNAALTKVGGPGREFDVFGVNYPNDPVRQRTSRKRADTTPVESGAWRVELSPAAAAAEDLFLTVMQTGDREPGGRLPVGRIDTGDRVGCLIEAADGPWCVLFRRDGRRSGDPAVFTTPGSAPGRFLLTDLEPGPWRLRREGGGVEMTLEVSPESGAAWFAGPAGTWRLSR